MYSKNIIEYQIDLNLSESDRWQHVIAAEAQTARELAEQATVDLPDTSWLMRAVGGIFAGAYALSGGRYRAEMKAWSKALGVSAGMAYLLNCSYELSHAAEQQSGILSRIFGCTAGVRHVKGLGMVHVRSLDWPLPAIGPATRLFHFVDDEHEFYSVGMPGFVGVLSGMVPGGYSVTINWAPPVERPTFDWGPAFLLREVLTQCSTYEEAVSVLSQSTLSTSVFYTVCGTAPNEACVIERTQNHSAIRPMRGKALVQGNHHISHDFQNNNDLIDQHDPDSLFACSSTRTASLKRNLQKIDSTRSLAKVRSALTSYPVQNEDCVQQMVFCPASGEVGVWRKTA